MPAIGAAGVNEEPGALQAAKPKPRPAVPIVVKNLRRLKLNLAMKYLPSSSRGFNIDVQPMNDALRNAASFTAAIRSSRP
jgi:hypothetical protein